VVILSYLFYRPESKVVEDISGRILSGLGGNFLNVSKVLVGIESRVAEMMSLLSIGLDDVRFLGIYGMGGIGKTSLSKVIYERISQQFEARCFIASIREVLYKLNILACARIVCNIMVLKFKSKLIKSYSSSKMVLKLVLKFKRLKHKINKINTKDKVLRMRNPDSPNQNNTYFMFININPKFSQIKSYVCFTMLQIINQNHPMYPFRVQITKGIQI
jgi:hypothetical protein